MLTQRLGSETQRDNEYIEHIISHIKENKGGCDEVWLATDYGYPDISVHKQSAEILGGVAEKFRKVGVRVSLQLSNCIGHGDYMSRRDCSGLVYEGSSVRNAVGEDGTVAKYCFCWNGEYFRNYVKEELKAYVTAVKPHTLWIDDDLRISHHAPAVFCCFCEHCVAQFNEKYGYSFDREGLVRAINDDKEIRKKHIEYIRASLADFVYDICKTVHECCPECRMGLQSYIKKGGYQGYGYSYIFDAMYKATGHVPASRPGGGMYDDYSPNDFIIKGEDLMYQMHMLPDYVTEIRPEIENLPFVAYGKSVGGCMLESSYYFAAGATDMSYSMMMSERENTSYYGKFYKGFAQHRKYWKTLSDYNKKSKRAGLVFALPKTGYLADNREDFDYTNEYFDGARCLRYINIPVCFEGTEDSVYLLSSDNARIMSDAEIKELLRKPVFADAGVAQILTARGFDCGADAVPIEINYKAEIISDSEINGSAKGKANAGQFRRSMGHYVLPTCKDAVILGNYTHPSPDGTVVEELISCAAVTTEYGAKWAFFGFDMWTRDVPTFIRDRFLSICEYLGGKRQCVELTDSYPAILLPRVNEKGEVLCVSVTNVTVADSGELEIVVRNPSSDKARFMSQYQSEAELQIYKNENGESALKIPNIKPWSVATVFFE